MTCLLKLTTTDDWWSTQGKGKHLLTEEEEPGRASKTAKGKVRNAASVIPHDTA